MNSDKISAKQLTLKVSEGFLSNSDVGGQITAKEFGEQFAKGIVNKLFPKAVEYGDIKSHFNTERLSSFNFTDFKELVIGTHYLRKKLTSDCTNSLMNYVLSLKTFISASHRYLVSCIKKR